MIDSPAHALNLRPPAADGSWHEVFGNSSEPRAEYQSVLRRVGSLRPTEVRALEEQMEATMREMGVHYGAVETAPRQPWRCDLLPHIFAATEWDEIVAGVQQRLKAFECFLRDVYGRREILRAGVVPIHLVLGSPFYQSASMGLPLPRESYLHLCGICLERDGHGALAVKSHQFGRAAGLAYMMQNRRALARVLPELLEESPVRSVADTPLFIAEAMREAAPGQLTDDPAVVLLSPGPESPAYYEHSFLARRTGISLVEGGDLLVLDDHLYLKTVRGLKRIDVVYSRVDDALLDPLVLRRGSMLGVPGLVHCLRRGTVTLLNAVGSQLADDRALLCFAGKIIRYYLAEEPILPTVPTYWLGDIDQREMVLENIADFRVEPISSKSLALAATHLAPGELAHAFRKNPHQFIAQPAETDGVTLHFANGKPAEAQQDHFVFALRQGSRYELFPGALTRVFSRDAGSGRGWVSKDTWVLGDDRAQITPPARPLRFLETSGPVREVTSRVAEAFYWMGRYLERAYHQAYLIQAIETLETEELNSAERKEYQPMWNRLLPPLETSAGESRRSITTRLDRYSLTLVPKPGSVAVTLQRVLANAESVQEAMSPEAWATLSSLRTLFQRVRYKAAPAADEASRVALRLNAKVTQRIPQFFAIASRTMLGDDGWRFCEIGERFERAVITANAVASIGKVLARRPPPSEIQLSAFLRLLGTRDAYRRVFQARAAPAEVLEILWEHPEAPRSVARCLSCCRELLSESAASRSAGAKNALAGIEELVHKIRRVDWSAFLPVSGDEGAASGGPGANGPADRLSPILGELLHSTLEIHSLISDGFLSHQAHIAQTIQPVLQGLQDGV